MPSADGSILIRTKVDTSGIKNGTKTIESGVKGISSSISKLGATMLAVFSIAKIIQFGKAVISAASELSNAMIGLKSIVEGTGNSFKVANQFIQDYISDGLVPATNAVTAYKNLLMRGYSTEQIEMVMIALKNSAAFGRSAALSYGYAVQSATEGLKNENSILVDNAGVTKNVSMMWKDYAESIGVGVQELTKQQKIQAEVNGIMEETRFQMGDAAKVADTWSGQTAMLSAKWQQFLVIVGGGLITVLTPVVRFLNSFVTVLINLANTIGSLMANLFGIQMQQANSTASAYDGLADSADTASSAESGLADSTEKSGKAAKGALAPFDDLDVLQQKTSSGSGGGGGGVATESTATTGAIEKATELTKKWSAALEKLKKSFLDGFLDGLGDAQYRIDIIKNGIEQIKDALTEIFSDRLIIMGAKEFLNSFAYMIGAMAGSFTSIGLTIGAFVIGGLGDYMQENVGRIRNYLLNMFDIGEDVNKTIADLFITMAYIFESFASKRGIRLSSALIGIFVDSFMGITLLLSKLARDILEIIVSPFEENKEVIRSSVEGLIGVLATLFETLKIIIDTTFDGINQLYDTSLKPFFDNFASGLSYLVNVVFASFNTGILPVLQEFADKFDVFATEHLIPFATAFLTAIQPIIDILGFLLNEVLIPLLGWVIEGMMPVIGEVLAIFLDSVIQVVTAITDLAAFFIQIFTVILSFFTDTFAPSYKKAWEAVGTAFSNVFTTMVDVAKSNINKIIGFVNVMISAVTAGLNAIITAVNSIKIDIPSWLQKLTGFTSFGFNLSPVNSVQIPALAQGAVIPPNNKFMAILGDQTSGTNIEAPLDTIKQALSEVLNGRGSVGTQGGDLVIKVGDTELIRVLLPTLLIEMNRQGYDTTVLGVS